MNMAENKSSEASDDLRTDMPNELMDALPPIEDLRALLENKES